MDGIRSEQVDASTSVCPGGIIGIRIQALIAICERRLFTRRADRIVDDE
jgi:hypothetical protein